LNQPRWPELEGVAVFERKVTHPVRWDWSYDLAGKNVGIIGNGASRLVHTRFSA
jgi:cation diffusion facilitator CzcD-associated flavoprotein CzcO